MHVLLSLYVFHIKDTDPRARVAALGSKQVEGLAYDPTFAPDDKHSSIRALLATVAFLDPELHKMDVVTAFLYGDLDQDIYMFPLPWSSASFAPAWSVNFGKPLMV